MARERLPLTFGQGLDRATGVTAVDPTSFTDLRNVDLYQGKAQARKGLTRASSVPNLASVPYTDIVHLVALRSTRKGAVFAYQVDGAGNHNVDIWQSSALGVIDAGSWSPALGWAAVNPGTIRIHTAEVNRKLFVAHDSPVFTGAGARYETFSFDADTGSQVSVQANLDGLGNNPTRFRGVVRHLNYLVGWGFGTNADKDRPEVVRISKPGEPTVFDPEHYFLAGPRGDPVLLCVANQAELIVFKETEFYAIVGSGRANFGIVPRDMVYGLAGGKLAVAVNGVVYFWSVEGPRATSGGPSVDMAVPLDLGAPEPSDLIASGTVQDGFAVHVPAKRQIRFHFGRRVYKLHLRDPQNPRWSYDETGRSLNCGGAFYGATDTPGASRLTVFYGQDGGNGLFKSDDGHQDDGQSYSLVAKSEPLAPAGSDGECTFPAAYLTVIHTMAITLRLTPYVDGVAKTAKDIVLTTKSDRTLEMFEVGFAELHSPSGTERGRFHLRGTWFSLKVESLGLATGDLLLEQAVLEYEVVRETKVAI